MFSILEASTDSDFQAARALFQEYATAIGIDLCFQNFAYELEHIREMYAPPRGCLLLASGIDDVVGCVAMRPFENAICEMKRLYVRPEARGSNLGRRLAMEVVQRARMADYERMVLDTLRSMEAAQALYRSLGFREIEPYYANPLPGVVYMTLDLR